VQCATTRGSTCLRVPCVHHPWGNMLTLAVRRLRYQLPAVPVVHTPSGFRTHSSFSGLGTKPKGWCTTASTFRLQWRSTHAPISQQAYVRRTHVSSDQHACAGCVYTTLGVAYLSWLKASVSTLAHGCVYHSGGRNWLLQLASACSQKCVASRKEQLACHQQH
jgi:hypothetical protein